MRHLSLLLLAGTVLISSTMTGCGQKGPLTLPAKPVEATTPAPVATPGVKPPATTPADAGAKTTPAAEKAAGDGAGSQGKDNQQGRPHVA